MRLWDNTGALRRINHSIYALIFIGMLAAGGIWLFNSPYFPIKSVKIEGTLKRLTAKQLQETAAANIQGNIFKADLNQARAAFEALPWVASAQVKRIWPDTVVVNIQERQPVARWESSGLVDENGELFDAPSDEEFPVFAGPAHTEKMMVTAYRTDSAILAPTGLKIERFESSPRGANVLTLNNGMILRLGRNDNDARLRRFVVAWHEFLHNKASQVRYADLRYTDGLAVRYGNATAAVDDASQAQAAAKEAAKMP